MSVHWCGRGPTLAVSDWVEKGVPVQANIVALPSFGCGLLAHPASLPALRSSLPASGLAGVLRGAEGPVPGGDQAPVGPAGAGGAWRTGTPR